MNARSHGRADGHALDVLTLGRRGLGADHCLDQHVSVLKQFVGRETHLADRRMDHAALIYAEFDLTGLDFLYGGGPIRSFTSRLRVLLHPPRTAPLPPC